MAYQELPYPSPAAITPYYTELVMEQSSIFYDISEALKKVDEDLALVEENGPFIKNSVGALVNNFLKICGTEEYTKGDSRKPDEVFYHLHLTNERIGKREGLPFIHINGEYALFEKAKEEADKDYMERSKEHYKKYEREYWAATPLSGFHPL